MWTEVQNPRRFMGGLQNEKEFTYVRFSLHRHGLKGWILKSYRGKYFVLSGSWRSVRNEWNEIIKQYS